ncbi:hypothetical protein [Pseudalkalibacillus decolorationis]|uniref:hypothetical protein n=1 Tax=Pseudalkalibacillus decolorationis TaxID=163879 RepID=UPI00214794A7|nr:hypothetical protein [Pseudalkalibacillus decolorationis]
MSNKIPGSPRQGQGGHEPVRDGIKARCEKYKDYHVMGQMQDGSWMNGIITDTDGESVTMLVPELVDGDQVNRQYGYDDDDDDYDDGYGGRRRRYRRYRRRRFPYRFFRRLFRYPYYYPYYPWFGYGGGYGGGYY